MFVVLLAAILSMQLERFIQSSISQQRIEQTIDELIDFRDELSAALEIEDFDTVAALLLDDDRFYRQFLVLDEFGNEILGRQQLPQDAIRHRFNHTLSNEFKARGLALSTIIISNNGQLFEIQIQPRMLFQPLLSPQLAGTIIRIALLVLISAVVCYFLTRALTQRIRLLQQATKALTAGNYTAAFPNTTQFNQDELGQLGKDFSLLAQRLEDSQHARKQMLSDISHELRSPLARMQVALEITRDKFPAAETQIARIEKEALRMNELITQIIHIQKSALGTDNEKRQQVDLITILEKVINNVRYEYQATSKAIQLSTQVSTAHLLGLEEPLFQAFENIIRNAMSHTKENTCVAVDVSRSAQYWLITVKDYGTGIPDTELGHIFHPFVRLDSSRNRKTGGYGLGLSIAKSVIKRHNGTIQANNQQDSGLLISIQLPIEKPAK